MFRFFDRHPMPRSPASSAGIWRLSWVLLVALPALHSQVVSAVQTEPDLRSLLDGFAGAGEAALVADQRLHSPELLREFYGQSAYRRAWVFQGQLTAVGLELMKVLASAHTHGLDARDYHLPSISALVASDRVSVPRQGLVLELLMSDGALTYARHLSRGKISPEMLYADWRSGPRKQDVATVLREALAGGPASLAQTFESLAPRDLRYRRLKALLAALGAQADVDLPRLPSAVLELEDRSPAVVALRKRLAAWEGDAGILGTSDLFDTHLEARVKQFQYRHGLEPDGVVGPDTVARLNRSSAERMRQVRVNMERWRWMPADLGERRIEVNIAGFRVDVMEGSRRVLSMRAIVGKPYQKTPVFSERMSYIVFNPSWNVPGSIAVKELLPKLQKNPGYLEESNMRVLDGWGGGAKVVDADGVDWHDLNADNFRYRLQQMPGENNALGQVKFMFPNGHDVYLHDTPERSLFGIERRGLSHGCVRLEKPMDLARYLLDVEGSWTQDMLDEVLDSAQETEVPTRARLPVHFTYWTVWVDGSGLPQFRDDVYERDELLAVALIGE